MRWLVTGGCGFIGSNLIKQIYNDDSKAYVIALDDLSVGKDENIEHCDKIIVSDIIDFGSALELCEHSDVVVHLAAHTGVVQSVMSPATNFSDNVIGTFNYLEAANICHVKKFAFASTGGAIVGDATPPINEDTKPSPISPYGCSKLCGENYCITYNRAFGLNTTCMRFSNVYGPISGHKKGNLVPTFINTAINNEDFIIYGDGNQTRDLIFVGDLVKSIISIVNRDVGGEVFQLATGVGSTVLQVTGILNDLSEKYLGRRVPIKHKSERDGEVRYNYCDITKATNMIGHSISYTLKEGLEETFKWFIDNEEGKHE